MTVDLFIFWLIEENFFRKRQKPVKNTENIEVNHQPNKDASQVMSYSRICLETDFSNSMPPGIRNNPNLVTFTSPTNNIKNQPLYANLPLSQNDANVISVPVNPSATSTNARYVNGQSHHIYHNATQ